MDKATGKTIFFPNTGYRLKNGRYHDVNVIGYWSGSSHLILDKNYIGVEVRDNHGYPIRCVADEKNDDLILALSETICQEKLPYTWRDTIFGIGTKTGEYCFRRTRHGTTCDSTVYLYLIIDTTCNRACKNGGIRINGICWAECNVDKPGTFTASPEAWGMLYQWNRKKAWPATGDISDWDDSHSEEMNWESANDPCPKGWRVPHKMELNRLLDDLKVKREYAQENGVDGSRFIDNVTGNTIFFPKTETRLDPFTPGYPGSYYSASAGDEAPEAHAGMLTLKYYKSGDVSKYEALSIRCVTDFGERECEDIKRDTSVTICAKDLPYDFCDTTFEKGTVSGTYVFRCQALTGCDSIITLHLTVTQEAKPCPGVLINGVCWAKSNVDKPGTFAPTPESWGMLYQWNRKKAWAHNTDTTGWDDTYAAGDYWEAINDPCPTGWRVPKEEEINSIIDCDYVNENYIYKFTDPNSGNTIIMPYTPTRWQGGRWVNGRGAWDYWFASAHNDVDAYSTTPTPFIRLISLPKKWAHPVRCVADWNVPECEEIKRDTSVTICAKDLPYDFCDTTFEEGTMSGTYVFQRIQALTGCDSIVTLKLTVTQEAKPIDPQCYPGVLIDGVFWSEYNVDAPGTFTPTPEAFGMFYQWNSNVPIAHGETMRIKDITEPVWEDANNPCPDGWRIPTLEETERLFSSSSQRVQKNGINGWEFKNEMTGKTIFIPIAGYWYIDHVGCENEDGDYWTSHIKEIRTNPTLYEIRYICLNESTNFINIVIPPRAASVRCVRDRLPGIECSERDTFVTICEKELPYPFADTVFGEGTVSGIYTFHRSQSVTGYDSIVHLHLTVQEIPPLEFFGEICQGGNYTENDFNLYAVMRDTIVRDTIPTQRGCDSVRILDLRVHPRYDTVVYDTVCQGDPYHGHGFTLTDAQPSDDGTSLAFHRTAQSIHGCDSVIHLYLFVGKTYLFETGREICQEDTVMWRGKQYDTEGTYEEPFITVHGCDSVYRLHLTVHPSPRLEFFGEVCQGKSYNEDGFLVASATKDTIVRQELKTHHQCDSVRTLYLTVHPVYDTIVRDTVCQGDAYYRHGVSISHAQPSGDGTPAMYRHTYPSIHGCDSTVTLFLTVHPISDTILYDAICRGDRYKNHGFSLDASQFPQEGTYSFSRKERNMHGCDSTIHLSLTVHPDYLFPRTAHICQGETFEFRDKPYTASGFYADTLVTIHGCDSVYTLSLTVHPVYDVRLQGVLCEGEEYVCDGFHVKEPGTHVLRLTSVHGCDSTVTLTLTEEKKVEGSIGFLLEDCTRHGYGFEFSPSLPVREWVWEMGDGTAYRTEEGYHRYADSGTYRVLLRTLTDNGCGNEFLHVQRVPPYLDRVTVRADRQVVDEEYPTVRFRAEVLGGMECEWDFGDGTTGKGSETEHTYATAEARTYAVTLRVTNGDGCITEEEVTVEAVVFPKAVNTFSPNGDGINDVFMAGFRIEVMNRNGLKIYCGEDGWDGTYKGGEAKEDTYFYRVTFRTATGERTKTGYVNLIR